MARKTVVRLTANFERNLEEMERFLTDAQVPSAFDSLLDELLETVIPNLERFPDIGRPFGRRQAGSLEAANALGALGGKLASAAMAADAIREYVMKHYLLLYAAAGGTIYLLSIRHQRQLSFDFAGHWEA